MPQRIGDVERDRAVALLRDHLAEGRLDQQEFDDRLTLALSARTQADLDPLFADLPGPRPVQDLEPASPFQPPPWQNQQPAPQAVVSQPSQPQQVARLNQVWGIVSALAWPAAIIFCFATDWRYWWVMLIPLFFPWWLNRGQRR
nr:DUF1707 domain-containing protein [Microlunatus panaciterrae]